MEYQNMINLLDSTANEPSKFRSENQVQINDDLCETYIFNNQIKFKTSMLISSLCDYADVYILVKGIIAITQAGADDAAIQLDKKNKGVIFKNCAPFTDCISDIK